MRRWFLSLAVLVTLALNASAAQASAPSQGNFGLNNFDVTFTNADETYATQAGSHPFALTTFTGFNVDAEEVPEGRVRDLFFDEVPGLVADTTAYPRCSTLEFLQTEQGHPTCSPESVLGVTATSFTFPGTWLASAVYSLTPPPGVLMRLGFYVDVVPVVVDVGLRQSSPYNGFAGTRNTNQGLKIYANVTQLWGNPSDSRHDELRGNCAPAAEIKLPPGEIAGFRFEGEGNSCPVEPNPHPLLTLPTECHAPLPFSYEALSWEGETDASSRLTHDALANPTPFAGCGALGFKPSIAATPTSRAAQSPTGLDFSLDIRDEGLRNANEGATAQSAIEKAVVTLPKGMTINPSQAEGLEVCTEAQLKAETLAAEPGQGCPEASKIGTIEDENPLVPEAIRGSLYVAEPYHNLAGNSLIAVYFVLKNPKLGVLVKQPARVVPDPKSGQLVTITEGMPPLPLGHVRLHFREGGRSPLVSPPGCGAFDAIAELYPRSGGSPVTSTSTFQIVSGPGGGPCPAGAAPFHPGFEAGSLNAAAGRYSPFYMRLTRKDGEQDMTKFSAVLPPGVVGKIAGIPYCPESGIARAMSRTGEHGGTAELHDPSCPAASQIGRTVAGAGIGSQLTYVAGKLYLAGSYHGDPLSVVSITPAVAGPFDAGTVVLRIALTLNPVTGEVEADGSASDPIPHILQGIPLNVREIEVYADRSDFTLNPTSCAREEARATLFGGGTLLAPRADHPVALFAPYQAVNCAKLAFKPKLAIRLRGGTRRGDHPALRAAVTPRSGDANFSRAVVTLPHSAFLDQGHIRTVCTRVQFVAGAGNGAGCPTGARYGYARAWTPLLDEPLQGPVFLRSSNHKLPDLVVALHGLVDIDLAARIDSIRGGIRTSFGDIPDAPVSRFILDMQGAKKGLIVNSTNLCRATHLAKAEIKGQNGRLERSRPAVQPRCAKQHTRHRRRGKGLR